MNLKLGSRLNDIYVKLYPIPYVPLIVKTILSISCVCNEIPSGIIKGFVPLAYLIPLCLFRPLWWVKPLQNHKFQIVNQP